MGNFQSLEDQGIVPGPADVTETAIQTFTFDEELENGEENADANAEEGKQEEGGVLINGEGDE